MDLNNVTTNQTECNKIVFLDQIYFNIILG